MGGESDRRLLYAFLDLPDRVAVVEALRFGPNPPSEGSSAEFSAVGHMVVLGDYDRSESEIVVRAAERVRGFFPEPPVATFRPHPLHVARDRDLVKRVTSINQDIRSDQICQPLVVASSRTSAFYSFLSSRIPVVIALGDQTLNFCPVSNFPGLSFVSASSAEASPSRAAISWPEGASGDLHGILALDDGLPRWLRALGLDQ